MYVANDINGVRVHIFSADRKNEYFCPICNSPMILKMGPVKAHHYAHARNFICLDYWKYDSSDWRFDSISRFSKEYQERVINSDGTKHIADVLIDDCVIEFQQGNLTQKEFMERNRFFKDLGLKALWLFDVRKEYKDGNLSKIKGDKELYTWKEVSPTLKKYKNITDEMYLFLQLDNQTVISVDWLNDSGLNFFGSNAKYTVNDFFELCSALNEVQKPQRILDRAYNKKVYFDRFSEVLDEGKNTELPLPENFYDLYDRLIYFVENNTKFGFYYCCPKKPNNRVTQKECGMCNSLSTRNGNVNKVCTFRFKPSEYKGCQIDNIFRDSEGRITQVNIVRNGLAEFKQYEKYPPIANDILSIWKEKCNNWYCAVFYNIQNGITAKVNFYQINNITKYKTLWGDVKYPMSSNYENKPVPYYDSKEWVLVYFDKNYKNRCGR